MDAPSNHGMRCHFRDTACRGRLKQVFAQLGHDVLSTDKIDASNTHQINDFEGYQQKISGSSITSKSIESYGSYRRFSNLRKLLGI
jgi:hypothetical protein